MTKRWSCWWRLRRHTWQWHAGAQGVLDYSWCSVCGFSIFGGHRKHQHGTPTLAELGEQ